MIDYPFGETLPAPGATLAVAPGVEWVRMPLPYALNHINLWLLADGDDAWCAVDTGMAMGDVQQHWERLLGTHALSRLLVTHYHPDHLGLAAWLQDRTAAPLWMTQGEYLTAQAFAEEIGNYAVTATNALFRRHGLGSERLAALSARGNAYKRGVPHIPPTYTRLRDGQCMRIGAHEWRVMVGHGHCPEHAALYCAELGLLIAGDMLLPSISTNVAVFAPNPDEDSLSDFLASIRTFTALPDDTLVLPSHGRPFRGIRSRVAALEQHHADRCAALVDACRRQAWTAAELLPVLFQRDITDPHQTLFAMSEAIAHLNHLQQRGALRADEVDGVLHFRAT